MLFKKTYSNEVIETFKRKKKNAQDRGLEFSLTLENIDRLKRVGFCYYSGESFSRKNYSFSIERIDSTKGYIPGNVIPVATVVNQIKSNFSVDEMKSIVNKDLVVKIKKAERKLKKFKTGISEENNKTISTIINLKKNYNTIQNTISRKKNKGQDYSIQVIELGHISKKLEAISVKNKGIEKQINKKKILNEIEKHKTNREIMIKIIDQLENNPRMGDDFMTLGQKINRVFSNFSKFLVLTFKFSTSTNERVIFN